MGANKPQEQEGPSQELLDQCKKEVHRALSSAVKNLFDDESNGGDFYAHILMQMDRVFDDPRIPTAAVSITNKINLYVNSYFFVHLLAQEVKDEHGKILQSALDLSKPSDQKLLQQRRAAVIKHETLHCILHHMSRGADFGNPMLANIAADLVVNSCIEKDIMGEQFLYPEKFNLPKDKSLDWYYTNYPIEDNPICENPTEHDKQWKQQSNQKNQDNQQDDQEQQNQQESKGQGSSEGRDTQADDGDGDNNSNHSDNHDHESSVDGQGKCKCCGGQRTFDNHNVWTEDGADHMSDAMKESLVNDAVTELLRQLRMLESFQIAFKK